MTFYLAGLRVQINGILPNPVQSGLFLDWLPTRIHALTFIYHVRAENRSILNYEKDSVIVGHLLGNETSNSPVLDDLVKCYDQFCLQLNTSKIKDTISDFRKHNHM